MLYFFKEHYQQNRKQNINNESNVGINFCNQFDLLVNNEFVVMVFSGTDL